MATKPDRRLHEDVDLEKFRVDHGKPMLAGDDSETIGYGRDGLVIGDPDSPDCLCKAVRGLATGTTRHYVKFAVAGPTGGSMVDPDEELDLGRRGDWTSSGRYEFRPVTKLAYDLYLNFVKTKNRAYLREAEREAVR